MANYFVKLSLSCFMLSIKEKLLRTSCLPRNELILSLSGNNMEISTLQKRIGRFSDESKNSKTRITFNDFNYQLTWKIKAPKEKVKYC